jgi:hypothetical protein
MAAPLVFPFAQSVTDKRIFMAFFKTLSAKFMGSPHTTNGTEKNDGKAAPPALELHVNSLEADLRAIREYTRGEGKFSWTSDAYQKDIVELVKKQPSGGCLVEVGCFRGGLSAQLAYMCRVYGHQFVYIDIDASAILSTVNLLTDLGISVYTRAYHGTLQTFAESFSIQKTIPLLVLDGDHEYAMVKKDIQTIFALPKMPEQIIFHDYSLRSESTGENVQRAIEEMLPGRTVSPVGQIYSGTGHPTKDAPQPDGHYWEVPGSEGALVVLSSS